MNNFTTRALFGAVYVAIVIGLLWWGAEGLLLLLLVISYLGIREFLKLKNAYQLPAFLSLCGINTLIILSSVITSPWLIVAASIWALIHVLLLIRTHGLEVFSSASVQVFAIVYISLPLTLFGIYSTSLDYNWLLPLLGFILVWSSDTFAYLSGKMFGKNPLYPSLSPGKTIEGFIGGTVLTAAMGGYLCWLWGLRDFWQGGFILGAAVSVVGTAGDLFESALKRNAGVKDSGNVIPGHGGILDRFDAFLFVCVLLWIWDRLTDIFANTAAQLPWN